MCVRLYMVRGRPLEMLCDSIDMHQANVLLTASAHLRAWGSSSLCSVTHQSCWHSITVNHDIDRKSWEMICHILLSWKQGKTSRHFFLFTTYDCRCLNCALMVSCHKVIGSKQADALRRMIFLHNLGISIREGWSAVNRNDREWNFMTRPRW